MLQREWRANGSRTVRRGCADNSRMVCRQFRWRTEGVRIVRTLHR